MKILQVMPQYPFPMVDGGKVGLGNIALEYARQGNTVHVLCYATAQVQRCDPKPLTIHAVDHSTRNTPLRILLSVFRRRSLYLWKHDTRAMHEAIDRVIREEGIEVSD